MKQFLLKVKKNDIEAKDLIQKAFNTEVIDPNVSGMSIAKGSHVKVRLSDLVEIRAQYSPKESQSHKKIRTYSTPNVRACSHMSTYRFGPSETRYLLCHLSDWRGLLDFWRRMKIKMAAVT